MSEDSPEYLPASNSVRRVVESAQHLPEPWPTSRPRGPFEASSRHLKAMRARLDWLVDMEAKHGEEQRGVHFNRAERNGLIWALEQLGPLAIGATPPPPPNKAADPGYVSETFERIERLEAEGFTRVDRRRPGWLLHRSGDDVAAVETSLTIWFYFRSRQDSAARIVPNDHKAVPIHLLVKLAHLIDPAPVEVDGKTMVFKNPQAPEVLRLVSAEVRKLIEYSPGQEAPQ